MNEFRKKLNELVSSNSYKGTLRAVADRAGVDHGLLHRVLNGDRDPTPEFVGRFCGMLNADEAKQLLVAFLTVVAKETAKAYPRSRDSAPTKITIVAEV